MVANETIKPVPLFIRIALIPRMLLLILCVMSVGHLLVCEEVS